MTCRNTSATSMCLDGCDRVDKEAPDWDPEGYQWGLNYEKCGEYVQVIQDEGETVEDKGEEGV